MKTLPLLMLVLISISCINFDIDKLKNVDNNFAIYIVKEGQLQMHSKPGDFDPDKLLLENTPWIKSTDIEFYDWSARTFFLNKAVDKSKYSGRHFVVCNGAKRLFAGVFFPIYLSSLPQLPAITPENNLFSPADVIEFEMFEHQNTNYLENIPGFYTDLSASGLLRKGLHVELTSVKKINSTSLEYSFQVENLDVEALYILDPDKMDCKFHYYTNGVSFVKDGTYYYSSGDPNCAVKKFDENWYYKLKPGEKISRSIVKNDFNSIPTGNATFNFTFPGSPVTATGSWVKSGGRVWIGRYSVTTGLNIK